MVLARTHRVNMAGKVEYVGKWVNHVMTELYPNRFEARSCQASKERHASNKNKVIVNSDDGFIDPEFDYNWTLSMHLLMLNRRRYVTDVKKVYSMVIQRCFLFSLVGSTPQAFANSIACFLSVNYARFPVTDVYFIASRENKEKGVDSTQKNIPAAIGMIQDCTAIMKKDRLAKVVFHEKPAFLVPEEDVINATIITIKGIKAMLSADDTCVIDMTAGRKTMGAAITLAASALKHKFGCRVYLSYYWLVRWTRENLEKRAQDLGIDDVCSIVFDLADLDTKLKEIT